MADWALCTTVKAPVEQVLAFTAHHLALGASQLWLFFDDPDDPAYHAVKIIPGVIATRCDATHWQSICNKRPEAHQNRQGRNMQWVYAKAQTPWLGHIDIDEYLAPSRPIADILAAQPSDRILLRMAPWEALHDASLPDDIFTATAFRAALKGPDHAAHRDLAFGQYAQYLPEGVLSHSAGKCFFRSGVRGLEPRLHGAFRFGKRLQGGDFDLQIPLLHFHAENRAQWTNRLPFRLTLGAYKFNPALQAYLQAASTPEITAFYDRVQNPGPETRHDLDRQGLLHHATLNLRGVLRDMVQGATAAMSDILHTSPPPGRLHKQSD